MHELIKKWYGFNLLEKYILEISRPYDENDFSMIKDLGFNYVRLPVDYRCYVTNGNFDEKKLADIDQAIEWGIRYGIHVTLNLHRAPGYCVNPPAESLNLWKDVIAKQRFVSHWKMFAGRYKGTSSEKLTFNLINEPPAIRAGLYTKAADPAIEAIKSADPERFIIVDGLKYGTIPVKKYFNNEKIIHSTRGYFPFKLTHYKAPWVKNSDMFPLPSWTSKKRETASLKKQFKKWFQLKENNVLVFIGEWGSYINTQHETVLSWMEDNLKLWQKYELGWAMWNFKGDFGILDSNRTDVEYEKYNGHKLDRKMND